ncbi:MAG: helix-turn-helix domain-containing protein [Candidatus Berkelbacteria bacterium]|nr:helix-turn-helix domain-containing protein [Candidatus Berkelbacteria bacterium]
MEEKLLTIAEAAEILGVSIDTLRRWDSSGKLVPIKKDGGVHRFYREKDLEIFSSDIVELAHDWARDGSELPSIFYCGNSAVFQARLSKLEHILMNQPGFERLFSVIIAIAGEIGNNSFDHNLGKWPDIPGIFFGYDINKKQIVLADRGLGILETLRQVRPSLKNHTEALMVAFTEILSGRSPEKRGNGLKFVREVTTTQPIDLFFESGDGEVRIKAPDKEFRLTRGQEILRGCFVIIQF